jgi:ABC-type sugar transport system ATPase subunit
VIVSPPTQASSDDAGAQTKPAVYQAAGLVKEYDDGQVKALRGVDFTIHEGELVSIVGPSGCGKSTLLQMLGALDRPSGGELLYRGQSLPNHPDPAAYRAKEIGFIFQSFHLLPTLTSLENVQVPMFETKRPVRERAVRGSSRGNFPVANGSGSPSRAASRMDRPCSSRTSLLGISTVQMRGWCWIFSSEFTANRR